MGALTLLMFGDDAEFEEEFAAKYLRPGDSEGLLSDFVFADLRYLCAVPALDAYVGKEGAPVNQLWFRNKLEAMEDNALKDPSWRTYAEEFMTTDTASFYDKLDRAFVAFQTDEGVSELNPRFDTDID